MSQLYHALQAAVEAHPTHEALIEDDTRWTYARFLEEVRHLAGVFQTQGIRPGDRVGLMLLNQKEFLVGCFAIRQMGGVVVPINIQMLPQDIGYVIQNAGLSHLLVETTFYPHVAALPIPVTLVGEPAPGVSTYAERLQATSSVSTVVPTSDTDLAFLIYTSGTTGYPKGVMLSEKNLLANMAGFKAVLAFQDTDRMVLALPLFHAYGLIVALTALLSGGAMVLVPKFHPKKIVAAMAAENVTILPLVPTLFTVVLDLVTRQPDLTFPHLRFCVSGGAALPAALLERIQHVLHAPVLEGYGLTETAPVLAVNDPQSGPVPGSVGKPLSNVRIRILREDGSNAVTGEVGEVVAQGDNLMLGYYNLPDDTRAAFTQDGWFRTGDLGHLDAEGRLYISGGRIKDLIIKAGENISPLPIEQVLYQHAGVREATVIGAPDDKLGEEICACVVLHEGHPPDPQAILRFCREHLSGTFVPGQVLFFDDLPKNATGKIVKKLVRDMVLQQLSVATL